MAKTVLTLDDEPDDDFTLIAIVAQIDSYRLAFEINRQLQLNLQRARKDYDVKIDEEMAYFDIYEKENEADDEFFYLINAIGHKTITEEAAGKPDLFGPVDREKAILVPELNKVDYLLKFKTLRFSEQTILRKLKLLSAITLSYIVTDHKIITHKNLIFN